MEKGSREEGMVNGQWSGHGSISGRRKELAASYRHLWQYRLTNRRWNSIWSHQHLLGTERNITLLRNLFTEILIILISLKLYYFKIKIIIYIILIGICRNQFS